MKKLFLPSLLIFVLLSFKLIDPLYAALPLEKRLISMKNDCDGDVINQGCLKGSTKASMLLQKLRVEALNGNVKAQYRLGFVYKEGWLKVPIDKEEAFLWTRLSAENGHPAGQSALGAMFSTGFGVPVNYMKAYKWTRLAALKGMAQAQSNLGVMYMYGHGVLKSEDRAIQWLQKAVDQGNVLAGKLLGKIYLSKGLKLRTKNADCRRMWACIRAFKYYEKAAHLKSGDAMVFLSNLYLALNRKAIGFHYPKWVMWLLLAEKSKIETPVLRRNVKGLLASLEGNTSFMKIGNELAQRCIRRKYIGC